MLTKIKRYLTGAGAVLCLAVVLNSAAVFAHRTLIQQGIAEEVLRFHVLANSDSETDQAVKLEVRDGILEWIAKEMECQYGEEKSNEELANEDKTKMSRFLEENLEEIEYVADQILEDAGIPYRAAAQIGLNYFPDRTYGSCTFPAGWYDTLQIHLGEAGGQNWWCVLYPRLCFSDYLHAVVADESLHRLEEVLTVEEYESLLRRPGKWKIALRWF